MFSVQSKKEIEMLAQRMILAPFAIKRANREVGSNPATSKVNENEWRFMWNRVFKKTITHLAKEYL